MGGFRARCTLLRMGLILSLSLSFFVRGQEALQTGVQSNDVGFDDANSILVSNVFFETDLRQALRDISEEAGVAILPDNTVQGIVTLTFDSAPLESVLEKILSVGGYTFRKIDDYYVVGAPIPENPSFHLLTETEYYYPNYIEVDQVPALLSNYFQPFIKIHPKMNVVCITAPTDLLNDIKAQIIEMDKPPQQILIEAIVTELSNEAKRSLGLDWSWLGADPNTQITASSNMNSMINDSSLIGTFIRRGVNFQSYKYDIIYRIKALATEGKADIKANPKVTTMTGQEASIFIGNERYFSIVTGPVNYPYTRLEKIPAGITLKILPKVSSEGEITVLVECEVSEVSEIGVSGLPLVNRRNAKTSIRVKNGEIIAIGGLTMEGTTKNQKKIPFLGSIPVLGYLFSHTKNERIEKELNIFISPHLLTDTDVQNEDQNEK
ncbi:type II secretion system protein GspD [candidate division KSB1 bacterium]|nr:type II secretion system protein GspD [candidate division KSB1 bacterium]